MKSYYHSWVLSERLTVCYDSSKNTEYLEIKVKGFAQKLVLRARPNSEFLPAANGNKFLRWDQSSYWKYDPKLILEQVKSKIIKLTFLGETYKSWQSFMDFICDIDIDKNEKKYRSTVDFPKSVAVAIHLRADADGKKMREILIDALRFYL
jgi:hypothetical protein